MDENRLNLTQGSMTYMVIGAHPDDCEINCAGTAAFWSKAGNRVVFLSITDGGCGHQTLSSKDIVVRRGIESKKASAVIGAESRNLGTRDGYLEANMENRLNLIREIRRIKPDVIITNRPNDYHPDHRYTAQLVQDSAYILMVPNVADDTPPLEYNPVIFYWADSFTYPKEFNPDVVINVDPTFETKLSMIHEHQSQVYEWLPYVVKYSDPVPDTTDSRLEWLRKFYDSNLYSLRSDDRYQHQLQERYGELTANRTQHAEAFEICEYGARPSPEDMEKIFIGM